MAAAREKDLAPPAQLDALAAMMPPRGKLARAYLVRGEERWFREAALAQLLAAARAQDLEPSRHDARDPDFSPRALQDDLTAAPMFASARAVVVRNAHALLKKESDEPLVRVLTSFAQGKGPPGGALFVDAESWRVDHALAKAVVAAGGRVLTLRRLWEKAPPWDPDPRRAELVQWFCDLARKKGVTIAASDAVWVCQATGNDLGALEAAIDRIREGGSARAVVPWTAGASPFEVADLVARGDARAAVAGVEALFRAGFQDRDGSREVDPNALLAILLGSLRSKLRQGLAFVDAVDRGLEPALAADAAGLKGAPSTRAAAIEGARARSAEGWRAMLADLAALERKTRRSQTVDASDLAAFALRWGRVVRAPAPQGPTRGGPGARGGGR